MWQGYDINCKETKGRLRTSQYNRWNKKKVCVCVCVMLAFLFTNGFIFKDYALLNGCTMSMGGTRDLFIFLGSIVSSDGFFCVL